MHWVQSIAEPGADRRRPGVAGQPIPRTMKANGLRGTPSVVLIDRAGRVRQSHFGQIGDLELGAHIGNLLAKPAEALPR